MLSLFKLLKTTCSHQGPFWPPRPRAHRYLIQAALLGKPMSENLGFIQLQFVSAAGPWLRFSRHSHCRGSCQGQADGVAARAKHCVNVSRTTTCTQCWLQHWPSAPTATQHLCLFPPVSSRWLHAFTSSLVWQPRDGLLRPAGEYTPEHKVFFLSYALRIQLNVVAHH